VTPTLTRVALGYVNAYLVGHPQRWVLIDTGERAHGAALLEAAARFAGDVPPQAIVLTHGHFDHAGGARELSQHWGVPIYASRFELPFLGGAAAYPQPDPAVGGFYIPYRGSCRQSALTLAGAISCPYNGAMPTAVITTKLYIPAPRPNAVIRAELIARLNKGLHHRLTLISAPAGFGKTSLVSAWSAGSGRPVAWLSLDDADTDLGRFLTHLVAALQTIAPTLGNDVIALLQSSQPPAVDALLPLLLNQIATLPRPALLVLDDVHVLDADIIHQTLAFLTEHLPPQLHLIIITREDPPLPLARLRARGQLAELRTADLRLTHAEASAFLTEVMGLNLSSDDIRALEERTEGWIAGLQLAALSLRGHQDVPTFIRTFAGDHRYVLDYLIEEVLQRQAAAVRDFLLQTAILDRLHGPLCDAVTGQEQSGARLESLHRGNFFVVPLDERRQWYRYHHLFADVLAAQLVAERPAQVTTLHRRASVWYEHNGALSEAIHHALAALDITRAADLIELAAPAMRRDRQEHTLLAWLRALPEELIASRPVLSIQHAGVLLSVGELAGVEGRLAAAERWLGTPAPESAVRDAVEFRQLSASIALYRAAHALALGDVAAATEYGGQVLDRSGEDDPVLRGAASGLLGLAHWTSGNLEGAYQSFADGLERLREAGNIADAIGGAIALVDIRVTQGRLREARRLCERGLQLAAEHGAPHLRGTADMHVGLSELALERGDLRGALEHLSRSQQQGEHTGFPQHPYRWRVVLARVRIAHGDLDGALELLEEAERRYVGDFFPPVRPVAAWKARLWAAQGRLGDALLWAQERGLSAHDELSYIREFEHLTLARVLLARSGRDPADRSLPEAIGLLERLLQAADAGGRTGNLIEILVLHARALQLQGDIPAALASLSHALTLAEPEGHVRVFVDEGPAIAALLEAQSAKRKVQNEPLSAYCDVLLTSFRRSAKGQTGVGETVLRFALERSNALAEPLSEREREVLRLLRTDLGGPEIARELVVSLNTLRTHTRNIYAKLGVSGRRAAVRRADELGLG
jgi:LuxR family maltose regulon positive regulatory protein